MRGLVVVCAVLIAGTAFSQDRRPGEPEHKAEAAQSKDQYGRNLSHLLPPSLVAGTPVVNVYTGKHTDEKSHCAEPKDWKEWGSFTWCRSVEWIDPERVIAIWTVVLGIATCILGIATWKLWRSTDRLVESAEITSKHQLRAYVFAKETVTSVNQIQDRNGQLCVKEYHFQMIWENVGLTPAKDVRSWIKKEIFPKAEKREPTFHADREGAPSVLGPRTTFQTQICIVPLKTLIDVWRNQTEVYIWARVEYRDIFNPGKLHHHEMCGRLVLLHDPSHIPPDGAPSYAVLAAYGPQNTAD